MAQNFIYRGIGVDDNEWYYGNLVNVNDMPAIIFGSNEYADGETHMSPYWTWVFPYTIGMETKLNDHEGTEIFDGDLLKSEEGFIGLVVYDETLGSFVLRTEYGNGTIPLGELMQHFNFTIIGNIHDNPGLFNFDPVK